MTKVEEAREILTQLQVPKQQQSDLCCYVLLAMAYIQESANWEYASNDWIRIHDIISFTEKNYGVAYAENSRETFRKQAIHHFRNAAFIEDNGLATNSPNYRYRLTEEMLLLITHFGKKDWEKKKASFLKDHQSLIEQYASKKTMQKMSVKMRHHQHVWKHLGSLAR